MNIYFELLISKLRDKIRNLDVKVNMVRWYNFSTFDIIGDLCFGESFGMLEKGNYDFWIANIFKGIKLLRNFRVLRAYPLIGTPILYLIKKIPAVMEATRKNEQYTRDRAAKRMASETDRCDFMR